MFAGADITAAMPAADGTARPSVDAAELQATNTHALVLQHCLWQHAL
jgi:hypothetical protein